MIYYNITIENVFEFVNLPKYIDVSYMNSQLVRKGQIAFFGGSFTLIEHDYMIELLNAATEFVNNGLAKSIRFSFAYPTACATPESGTPAA